MSIKKLLVALTLTACLVTGCGSDSATTSDKLDEKPVEEDNRFESSEMDVPDVLSPDNSDTSEYIGNKFNGFISSPDGKPAVYSSTVTKEFDEYKASILRYTPEEATGEDVESWEENELCKKSLSKFFNDKHAMTDWMTFSLDTFSRGDDGSLYAIFTYYITEKTEDEGEEGRSEKIVPKYSLLEIDEENNQVYEIALEGLEGPEYEEGMNFRGMKDVAYISDYHVYEDDRALIIIADAGGSIARLFDTGNGSEVQNMGNIVSGRTEFAFGESSIIFYSKDKKAFVTMGVPELDEENVFGTNLSDESRSKEWFLHMNPDTWELYMFNTEGIFRADNYDSSEEAEYITKGTDMGELVQTGFVIRDFFMQDDDNFYICMMSGGGEDTGYSMDYNNREIQYNIVHYKKLK